jgi:hypothetical protein
MESTLLKHPGAVSARTFEEVFVERHGCTLVQFRRRVFWRTLHWHALFLAPLFLLKRYSAADFDLIAACGRAQSMGSLREEIEAYRHDPRNEGWLRRRARIRLSGRRLLRMAYDYLER